MNSSLNRLDRILLERAKKLAVRASDARVHDRRCPVVVCVLGKERYALELTRLREIVPFARWTPLPTAPREVLGIMNVRGEILPVLSLRRLLAIPESEEENEGFVVLIQGESAALGLRVDNVLKIDTLEEQEWTSIPKGRTAESAYLRGWTQKGMILLETQTFLKWSLG